MLDQDGVWTIRLDRGELTDMGTLSYDSGLSILAQTLGTCHDILLIWTY